MRLNIIECFVNNFFSGDFSDYRSIVIKSAHPKIFSPGHNVAELKNFELHQEIFATCKDLMRKIREVDVPVIAQVTGLAVAAGAQLAIAAG